MADDDSRARIADLERRMAVVEALLVAQSLVNKQEAKTVVPLIYPAGPRSDMPPLTDLAAAFGDDIAVKIAASSDAAVDMANAMPGRRVILYGVTSEGNRMSDSVKAAAFRQLQSDIARSGSAIDIVIVIFHQAVRGATRSQISFGELMKLLGETSPDNVLYMRTAFSKGKFEEIADILTQTPTGVRSIPPQYLI